MRGYLEARRLLLIGRLDDAERTLDAFDAAALPPASRTGHWLVPAGIAMRRVHAEPARAALDRAAHAAGEAGISSLAAEVDRASRALAAPAACLIAHDEKRLLGLADVEALIASGRSSPMPAAMSCAPARRLCAFRPPGAVRARPRARRGLARRCFARNADRARLPGARCRRIASRTAARRDRPAARGAAARWPTSARRRAVSCSSPARGAGSPCWRRPRG